MNVDTHLSVDNLNQCSDTPFTAEPIGDQLSSFEQESQDTTKIVQTSPNYFVHTEQNSRAK